MSLKKLLLRGPGRLAAAPGVRHLARVFQGQPEIVGYHRVLPESEWLKHPFANPENAVTAKTFDAQLRFYAQNHRVVTPDRLAAGDAAGRDLIITFDDGFADFETQALPLLERHGLPATVYVTWGFVDGDPFLWWYDLDERLSQGGSLDFTWRGRRFAFDLDAPAEAWRALGVLSEVFVPLAHEGRKELAALLGEGFPKSRPDWMLSQDALVRLAGHELVTIGAHTLTHPALRHLPRDAALRDMRDSRLRLEALLGRPVRHFAYPYGGPGQAGPREYALAEEAGFATAVTTIPGQNVPATSRFALRRGVVHENEDQEALAARTRGLNNLLRRVKGAVLPPSRLAPPAEAPATPPGADHPFFSLILCTVDRTETLPRLLDSLAAQDLKNFELIVVDQNRDDRLEAILAPYAKRFPLARIRSPRGLSRARNAGLREATGRWVLFPDDDCWLPHDLLSRLALRLADVACETLTFRVCDEKHRDFTRFARLGGYTGVWGIWTRACSISLCVRREACLAAGGFDEDFGLGAGTRFEGAEDLELPIRLMKRGGLAYYEPSLVICHPATGDTVPRPALLRRVRAFGPAVGRVWRIHRLPLALVVYHLARPLGGAFLSLVRGRLFEARARMAAFTGRLKGWLADPRDYSPPPPLTGREAGQAQDGTRQEH